jgi:hypothetical protein
MSGIFNAQRAAYCGLVLAGIRPLQAMAISRTSKETLKLYVGEEWFEKVSRPRRVRASRAPLPYAPSARNRAIIEHFQSGHRTMKETGDAFGITRERVRQILEVHGIHERTFGAASPATKAGALAAYRQAIAEGKRAHEAVAATGTDYQMLKAWAEEAGDRLPKPRSFRRERWPEIARYYQEHPELLQHHVARHFNCSNTEVSNALKACGVTSRWWKSPETAARKHAPRPKKRALPQQVAA